MKYWVHYYLQPKAGNPAIVAKSARNGKVVVRSTKKEIKADEWDENEQLPRKDGNLRKYLISLRTKLQEKWDELSLRDRDTTFDEVWAIVFEKKPVTESASIYVAECIEIYASEKKGQYKDQFRQVVLALNEFKPNLKFKDFDSKKLHEYFNFLDTKKQGKHKSKLGVTESTKNAHRMIIRMVAEFAKRKGYPVNQDALNLKLEKVVNKRGLVLTLDELLILRDYKGYSRNEQNAVDQFLFEAFTGIRHGDIKNLRQSTIKHTEELGDHIELLDWKTKRIRVTTVHNLNKPIIDKYNTYQPNELLFPTVPAGNRLLKSAAKKAGLTRKHSEIPNEIERPVHEIISTHDGRHTYASLLKKSVDFHYVLDEIGWVVRGAGGLLANVYGKDVSDRVRVVRNAVNELLPKMTNKQKIVKLVTR